MQINSSPAFDDWRMIIDQFRAGKRTNPQLTDKYAATLSSLLQLPSSPVSDLVQDFSTVPSGVVGRAFGRAYGSIPREKREEIWTWIRNQSQDRQDAERTYA